METTNVTELRFSAHKKWTDVFNMQMCLETRLLHNRQSCFTFCCPNLKIQTRVSVFCDYCSSSSLMFFKVGGEYFWFQPDVEAAGCSGVQIDTLASIHKHKEQN